MLKGIAEEAERQLAAKAAPVLVNSGDDFKLRGGALELLSCEEPEVILSGPADTGKTIGSLVRLHRLASTVRGFQGAIIRKTRESMTGSVLSSYMKKVVRGDPNVRVYGGEKPEFYDYKETEARIWVGGMDKPGKTLSSERDAIYVNQAEELTLEDWEYLTTRANGRAGNMPYGQVFGDCNPGPPLHWIKQRATLKLLESRHEDNPELFDDHGHITPQGLIRIGTLERLTGVRKERLRFGRWVAAEGTVYEFDAVLHVLDYNSERFPYPAIPAEWRRIRAVDFGFSNPFVCHWWAIDGDGRMYLYREIYLTGRLVEDHAREIVRLTGEEHIEATVADHDAEDRATLERHGVPTIAANKAILPGIEEVKSRLKKADDGKARIFHMRSALVQADPALLEKRLPTSTEQEYDVYMYPKAADGRPIKELPLDLNNHGMDTERYAVRYVDNPPPEVRVRWL